MANRTRSYIVRIREEGRDDPDAERVWVFTVEPVESGERVQHFREPDAFISYLLTDAGVEGRWRTPSMSQKR